MEESYWKQFCTTGAVEDYLHYVGLREQGTANGEPACTQKNREDIHKKEEQEPKGRAGAERKSRTETWVS